MSKFHEKCEKFSKSRKIMQKERKFREKLQNFLKTNAKFKGKSCENSFIKDYCENTTHF